MTPEEKKKMDQLCLQIVSERDPTIFDQLVRELGDLLEVKRKRIQPEPREPQSTVV